MLYYTVVGDQCWESLSLLFEGPTFSFWGEHRIPAAPPLEFFNRRNDPDDPNTPYSTSDSDEVGSPAPSNGSNNPLLKLL